MSVPTTTTSSIATFLAREDPQRWCVMSWFAYARRSPAIADELRALSVSQLFGLWLNELGQQCQALLGRQSVLVPVALQAVKREFQERRQLMDRLHHRGEFLPVAGACTYQGASAYAAAADDEFDRYLFARQDQDIQEIITRVVVRDNFLLTTIRPLVRTK